MGSRRGMILAVSVASRVAGAAAIVVGWGSGASSRIRISVEVVERRGLPLAGGFRDGEAGDGEAGDGDGEAGDGDREAGDGEAGGRPLSIRPPRCSGG